jgi:hypothetical protein
LYRVSESDATAVRRAGALSKGARHLLLSSVDVAKGTVLFHSAFEGKVPGTF